MSVPERDRPGAGFITLLGAMSAVPAVTMDMYLPSMPEMARELATTPSMVQGTISAMLIGTAVGQLLNGPLSDRYGRKRPFLVGITLHIVMSLLCAFAPDITALLAFRMLQGAGNAAAMIAAWAVLRDRYSGPGMSAAMSQVQMVITAAPILAPMLGSAVATLWGWRSIFYVLALLGVLVGLAIYFLLPETLPPSKRATGGLGGLAKSYLPVVRDGRFWLQALVPAMTFTVLMAYVSASSFVYQVGFGLTREQFVIVFATNAVAIIAGAQLNSRIVFKVGPQTMLFAALGAGVTFSALLVVCGSTGLGGVGAFTVLLFLSLGANATAVANGVALALQRQGGRAGTATALLGSLQQLMGAVFSPFVGLLGGGAAALGGVILAAFVLGLTLALLTRGFAGEA